MTIVLTIYPYGGKTSEERAESLFDATGACKFVGAYVRKLRVPDETILCDQYEFNIPQAFTTSHPAIRYLQDKR